MWSTFAQSGCYKPSMQWQKFKKLNYLVDQKDKADTCVVLFHGYGADANDLGSLAQIYKIKETTDWYFPQGVLEVPIGPMMSGRAWFELRVSDFEQVSGGKVTDVPIRKEDEKVIQEVCAWLNHLGKLYKNVFIGGFSQGAILTSHAFYRLNFTPKALVLLSGFLVAPAAFPTLAKEQQVPFFQSHGERDEVLNVAGAQKLFNKLQDLGMKGQWHSFNGGHEIPLDVIAESQIFLNSVLEKSE